MSVALIIKVIVESAWTFVGLYLKRKHAFSKWFLKKKKDILL